MNYAIPDQGVEVLAPCLIFSRNKFKFFTSENRLRFSGLSNDRSKKIFTTNMDNYFLCL